MAANVIIKSDERKGTDGSSIKGLWIKWVGKCQSEGSSRTHCGTFAGSIPPVTENGR